MWFNKYMFSVYVIVALLVAACASSKGTTHNYLCSDGNRFQVTMTPNGEKVILRLGERLLELPHVRSASGAKYSDGET
ncbi:MAG: lysozyme inhibitor, partial [Desulfobacterales bacterium]|nr:lysozyme inhibitor [Desulfobacterales bacterium]